MNQQNEKMREIVQNRWKKAAEHNETVSNVTFNARETKKRNQIEEKDKLIKDLTKTIRC